MKQFVGGFAVGAIIVGGAGLWLAKRVDNLPIRWPSAAFYDSGSLMPETGYLRVNGTLVGEDMNGGTYLDVECDGDKQVCEVRELSQSGSYRQVFLWTDAYPIKSVSADQMVAESNPPDHACNRVRLVMDRVAKVTHYYRIPNPKADRSHCAAIFSTNKVFDWTLGNQPT